MLPYRCPHHNPYTHLLLFSLEKTAICPLPTPFPVWLSLSKKNTHHLLAWVLEMVPPCWHRVVQSHTYLVIVTAPDPKHHVGL